MPRQARRSAASHTRPSVPDRRRDLGCFDGLARLRAQGADRRLSPLAASADGFATAWVEAPNDASSFAARVGADAHASADLEIYRRRLAEWSLRMNLVGPSAQAQFWSRHAFDSAQLRLIAPAARTVVDLGSGAGFPGVILAVLLRSEGGHVHLIESQAKRCNFLQAVVDELDLPATVHCARAEAGPHLRADLVTARACAPLERLLGFAQPYLGWETRALFLKGRNVESELAQARRLWRFDAALHPSLSDPEGRIVSIERLSRA